jgi:hypothetical protein
MQNSNAEQISFAHAGLEAGIEAAVHAVNNLFSEHAGLGWGVLLVDNRYDLFCLFYKYGL